MSRKMIITMMMIAGLYGSATALPNDQDDRLEDIGSFVPLFFAELQDVELQGDRAYVFGVGGLAVMDISDPENPTLTGRFEPVGHPYNRFYRGAVAGNLALGGGREDLLSVMSVPAAGDPVLLSIHGLAGQSYEGVALNGNLGFACRHGDGLEIIDFSSPVNPVTLGEVTSLVNAWDVALFNDHAYVADGAGGLAVIDISDPGDPQHLTSLTTSGSASDVVTDGNLLVVTCGSAGIDIFTLEDPSNPALASNANTSGLAITAALAGSSVYVADWDDVEIFNLTNPSFPEPAGGENTPVRAMGLAARPDLVVVADWSRLRNYRPGPSTKGDIEVTVTGIDFGAVPVGAVRDTFFTVGNTGGGQVTITEISEFSDSYSILTPGPVVIPAGQSAQIGVRFHHLEAGYAGTFLRLISTDRDETTITLPLSADDHPSSLNLGEYAPGFLLQDMGGAWHTLNENLGRVVVMAYFANW